MTERDPRQECGCPPFVVQCVHLGLHTVWLAIVERRLDCFAVIERVRHSAEPTNWLVSHYFTLPEAQAEFTRRAEMLRLEEPARA